ncbi:hypothetical protein AAG906_010217 [Vitis piasezkii]
MVARLLFLERQRLRSKEEEEARKQSHKNVCISSLNLGQAEFIQRSGSFYSQPVPQDESCQWPILNIEHHSCSDDGAKGCTSLAQPIFPIYNSPSTVSFSPEGSPASQQDSQTYPSDQLHSLRMDMTQAQGIGNCYEKWKQMMEVISRGDLKEVLVTCAKAVADNDILRAEWGFRPIQRLGAYLLEGLVARLAASGSSIYKALRCKEPASAELLSYMHLLFEICPYFKFGHMAEMGLLRRRPVDHPNPGSAARPGGPPQIRITGIDDSTSAYARGGGPSIVGQRLSRFAESCKVPFEFHAATISGCEVQLEDLELRPGEALAVNFAFILHHMPDESVDTQNHRDRLLRLVKSLSPKVVTLVEQESNTNTAPFLPRFIEAMNYYLAVFESIDVTLPRDHKERINAEQHCLAREIVNMIACEGAERVERHELLGKWKSRFLMAGFTPHPLSSYVNATIKTLLQNYSDKYSLEEKDGALYLGWMDRALVAACAWS